MLYLIKRARAKALAARRKQEGENMEKYILLKDIAKAFLEKPELMGFFKDIVETTPEEKREQVMKDIVSYSEKKIAAQLPKREVAGGGKFKLLFNFTIKTNTGRSC